MSKKNTEYEYDYEWKNRIPISDGGHMKKK